ncbi:choice-of-anchor Q domain-containing protein [Bacteroidota bacterium]
MRKIITLVTVLFLTTNLFAQNIRKPREKYLLEENKRADITEYLEKETKSNYKGKANVQDSLALLALYNTTNGPNWSSNNWLTCPVSEWTGITLDNDGRVKSINLYQKELNGIIPPEIGNLTKLESLDLYWNKLSGSIPKEIGNLVNLEFLYLNYNHLTGSIPSELGNLTSLRYLHLNLNRFSGTIPPELGSLTNLITLYLKDNYLSGSIPPELGNLSSLEILSLYDNELSGNIPSELGNLSKLESLHLEENNLTGNIPSELGNLTSLEYLDFYSNRLSGILPSELGNLSQLRSLDLGINMLSGDVPVEIGNLDSLRSFFLENNQFEGLPDLSGLVKLNYLWVWNNKLTFEDLEPNVNINAGIDFDYYPQEKIGTVQHYSPNVGDNLSFSAILGGTVNDYDWYRNNQFMSSFTTNTYTISDYSGNYPDEGIYYCKIDNAKAPDITIETRKIYVGVDVETYAISVTADPSEGGIVSGGGNYDEGETIKLVATPNTGYKFKEWTEASSMTTTFDTLYHTVEKDRDFVANFEKKTFYVSSHVSASGGGTKIGEGIYEYGEMATLVATPLDGYSFDNWTYNGSVVSTSLTLNVNVYSDMTITANFKSSASTEQTYYVKPSSNGGNDANDGHTWATAMANPQTAINAAESAGGGEVWVATGEYNPTLTESGNTHVDSTRYYSFTMKNNVKVYGGFAGMDGETIDSRLKNDTDGNGTIEAWEFTNPTILSGEIQSDADSSNNSLHIVIFRESCDSTSLLNGCTIEKGYGDIPKPPYSSCGNSLYASGIYSINKGNIQNCIVRNCLSYYYGSDVHCYGIGIYGERTNISNCLVTNCYSNTIGSSSNSYGGGIYCNVSTVSNSKISNCTLKGNGPVGGGISSNFSSKVKNCIISNCSVYTSTNGSVRGGGVANDPSSTMVNCIVNNCSATSNMLIYGSGIENSGSLINCIVANCNGVTSTPNSIKGIGVYSASWWSKNINCIVWNNTINNESSVKQVYNWSGIVEYCAVQDQNIDGIKNLCLTKENINIYGPLFYSPTSFSGVATNEIQEQEIINANWNLLNGSICINSGTNDALPENVEVDIIGNPRILYDIVDIGPYEASYSCLAPKNLNAENITETSADLSWDGGYNETNWNLEWGKTGFTLETGTKVSVETNNYTISNLPDASSYDFYVQSVCDDNNKSTWVGPYTFVNGTYHVKLGGDDSNDGFTWESALANPQTALNRAEESGAKKIFVAKGIYYPLSTESGNIDSDSIRHYTFTLKSNVEIYGGFDGNLYEDINSRLMYDKDNNGNIEPWEFKNETVLSGNIQNDLDSTNNSYHVVTIPEITDTIAKINGFTISEGYSDLGEQRFEDDYTYSLYASGILSLNNGLIENCIIKKSETYRISKRGYGGGVYLRNSSLKGSYINNCKITIRNTGIADFIGYGGGIYSINSSVVNNKISNCGIFEENPENYFYSNGGGIYNKNSSIINSIVNNCYAINGGGIYGSIVIGCTITNCKGEGSGSGVYVSSLMANTIVWNNSPNQVYVSPYNTTISNCAVQDEDLAGTNNIVLSSENCGGDDSFYYPCFRNAPDSIGCVSTAEGYENISKANFNLLTNSNCINTGSNEHVPPEIDTDIIGNNRIINGIVDIGAYEYSSEFTVTIITNTGGSVNPSVVSANNGDDATITITPDSGYEISTATYNSADIFNDLVQTGESYTYDIIDITSNGVINITFTPIDYTVTANAGSNGSVTPTNATMTVEDSQDFTISCETGYTISTATNNGISIINKLVESGNDFIYTLTKVTEDITLEFTFKASEYDIVVSSNYGGIVSPTDATVAHGDDQTFTITTETGYEITTVLYNGVDVFNDLVFSNGSYTYTVNNVQEDGELTVAFSAILFNVIATSNEGGTIDPMNAMVAYSDSIVFYIAPDEGKTVIAATYNGVDVFNELEEAGDDFLFTVMNITEDGELNVIFGGYDYSVIATAGLGGNVTPTFSQVSSGANLTLTINCAASYQIETATYNGANVLSNIVNAGENCYTYTATNISEDGAFNVTFIPKTFSVTASANSGGTVTPASSTVSFGSGQVFTIIPMDYGYGVKAATYNDVDVFEELEKSGNQYTYRKTNIREDGEFEVTFGLIEYALIASGNTGGSVTPDTTTVYHGSSQTFIITPNENFFVSSASYNDVNVIEDFVESNDSYTYTVTDISDDGILIVTFSNSTGIIANPNISFNIFPNPTSGLVSIQLQENYSEFKLRIVDINGKVILINDHFNNQESLNLGDLPPGIYHIIVEYDKQVLTKRLIKK